MVRVLTYGTFDLLHYGHIEILRRAKALGDYLVVAISTDEFNKIKGKTAFYDYETRKKMLEAIRYVDQVIPEYSWDQKIDDIKEYRIDKVVMGSDWEGSDRFDYLKEYCDVVYLPRTPNISSSDVKERLSKEFSQPKKKKFNYSTATAKSITALFEKYHEKEQLQQNKVVFINCYGKGYGLNPKYVAEKLSGNDDLDLVWLTDAKSKEMPEGIRVVPYSSAKAVKEMATARVIVDNQLKPLGFVKRPHQFLVTLPQGSIYLDKRGFEDAAYIEDKKNLKLLRANKELADIVTSNSDVGSQLLKKSQKTKAYIYSHGTPQCDLYFLDNSKKKAAILDRIGLPTSTKICVWAPTKRENKSFAEYSPDFYALLRSLGEDWVIAVNQHPLAKREPLSFGERVYDISDFDDSQEVICCSDMLITDYSSIMFEYMLSKKPCFLFTPDLEKFEESRELNFMPEMLPFSIACSTEELIENISSFDKERYKAAADKFSEELEIKESGNVSEQLAMIICRMCNELNFHINEIKNIPFRKYVQKIIKTEPVVPTKIVFSQFGGAGYGCNPKAICDEIIRRGYNWDLAWILKKEYTPESAGLPPQVRAVYSENQGKNVLEEFETASVWINNIHFYGWADKGLCKREGQLYINTFHGGISLKCAGDDRPNFQAKKEYQSRKFQMHVKDCEMVDYAISSSDLGDQIVDKFFMGQAKILRLGDARSDILINGDDAVKEKVHKHFGVPMDTKIFMYAPTFRDDADLSCFTVDYTRVLEALKKRFGGKWVAFAKLHPRIEAAADSLFADYEGVIDATSYNDMQELMLTADVMVSDYSSVLTDFMLSRKPAFMFTVDLEKYMETRGLYFSLEELPFPISVDNDALIENIENFNEETYVNKVDALLNGIHYLGDGKAASRVVDLIAEHINSL